MMDQTALLIACGIALAVAATALPLLIRGASRLGLLDRPGGRKQHVGVIPLVGGLSALAGMLVAAIWFDGFHHFERMLLATSIALVAVGAWDDSRSLGVRVRILVQAIVILAMILTTGVYVHHLGTIFGHEIQLGWFGIPFTMFALIGLLNAFNLMDGIDGLAACLGLFAIIAILLTAGVPAAHGMSSLLILLGVALLPALVANLGLLGASRRCFLGDAGSTLIGYLVGWGLIYFSQQPATHLTPASTLWCVALPVLDTLAVIYRRVRRHQSPFLPDRGHIHHLLRDSGFSNSATLTILIATAIAIWLLGALARHIGMAAGSDLVGFCVLAVAYVLGTNRWYTCLNGGQAAQSHVATHRQGVVVRMQPLASRHPDAAPIAANDPIERDIGRAP